MDDLPPPLVLEILARLHDSADLARCRVASKTLNALSHDVSSINLLCTRDRISKFRSPEPHAAITPFKRILKNLICSSRDLHSLSFGVEKPVVEAEHDDVDERDDLHLTDARFVSEWLPGVRKGLRSLSISDFWLQSCWRRSEVLSLISDCCNGLLTLEIKNAWLSVDGLKTMSGLTSLTLEYIRLDDEDLEKLNENFPSLQVLNLVGVGGLKDPKIHMLQLKTCQWLISNAPRSLTIQAPILVELKLHCVSPKSLVLETPLVSQFHLSLADVAKLEANGILNLKTFGLVSSSLSRFIQKCSFGRTVEKLSIDASGSDIPVELLEFRVEALFDAFPNAISLTLRYGAWSKLENACRTRGLREGNGMKALKELVAYLVVNDIEITLSCLFSVVDKFTNLLDASLFIHKDVDVSAAGSLVSRCIAGRPRVRWRWGTWKEGTKDAWVFSGV